MKKILLLTLVFLGSSFVFAQSPLRNKQTNNNGWFMYFGSHKFSEHWGIHLEAQFRRNEIIAKPQQLLLRTGVNYHFAANAFLTAGYCYVHTSPYGVFPASSGFPENRFWEQLQVKSQAGRIEMITRLRLEQRFTKLPAQENTRPATMCIPTALVFLCVYQFHSKEKPLKTNRCTSHATMRHSSTSEKMCRRTSLIKTAPTQLSVTNFQNGENLKSDT